MIDCFAKITSLITCPPPPLLAGGHYKLQAKNKLTRCRVDVLKRAHNWLHLVGIFRTRELACLAAVLSPLPSQSARPLSLSSRSTRPLAWFT